MSQSSAAAWSLPCTTVVAAALRFIFHFHCLLWHYYSIEHCFAQEAVDFGAKSLILPSCFLQFKI